LSLCAQRSTRLLHEHFPFSATQKKFHFHFPPLKKIDFNSYSFSSLGCIYVYEMRMCCITWIVSKHQISCWYEEFMKRISVQEHIKNLIIMFNVCVLQNMNFYYAFGSSIFWTLISIQCESREECLSSVHTI
jgi:hypothetical protein